MNDELTYEQGAAMGYRLGITFALRSLQLLLNTVEADDKESIFDHVASIVWRDYLTNPQFLEDEIERQLEYHKNKKQEQMQLQVTIDDLLVN